MEITFKELMEKYPESILGFCSYSSRCREKAIMESSFIVPNDERWFSVKHNGVTDLTWNENSKGFYIYDEDGSIVNRYGEVYNIYIPCKIELTSEYSDIKDFLNKNPDIEIVYLPIDNGYITHEFLEIRKHRGTGEIRIDCDTNDGYFSSVLEYTFSNITKEYKQGLISTEIEQTRIKFKVPTNVKYTIHKNESYLYTPVYDTKIITGYFYKKITSFE